jgi:hypothetical protein
LEGGPPSFPQTHRGSWYSGSQPVGGALPLPDSHPLWWRLPTPSSPPRPPAVGPPTPKGPQPPWFGLSPFRSPLLRASRLISLRRATEMVQFAHGPPPCLWVQQGVSGHHARRVAPFGSSGLSARMQLPLNVSPVSASFFGLQRRGILRVLVKLVRLADAPLLAPWLALGKIEVIMLFNF